MGSGFVFRSLPTMQSSRYVGVGLSVLCLLAVLAVYGIVAPQARTKPKAILMHLSGSLMSALIMFLIVAVRPPQRNQ